MAPLPINLGGNERGHWPISTYRLSAEVIIRTIRRESPTALLARGDRDLSLLPRSVHNETHCSIAQFRNSAICLFRQ
jgi:hypothetical protein